MSLKFYNLIDLLGVAPAGTVYHLSEVTKEEAVIELANVEIGSMCGQPRLSLIETSSGPLLSVATKEGGWLKWVVYDLTGLELASGDQYISAGLRTVPIGASRGAYTLWWYLSRMARFKLLRGIR